MEEVNHDVVEEGEVAYGGDDKNDVYVLVEEVEPHDNKLELDDRYNQFQLYMSHHRQFQKLQTEEYKLQHVHNGPRMPHRQPTFR